MPGQKRLGEQVTRLIRSLAALKGWNMTYAMNYVAERTSFSPDMVHRWRQGRSCPSPETTTILAEIGKNEANLEREWGVSLLHAARHPEASVIEARIWGPKEIYLIPNNLPPLEHTDLIGRESEIDNLLDLLSDKYGVNLITVDGIGGVGKTALVLEVAYRCLKASLGEIPRGKIPTFEAIIFVSAKQQYLTADGILPSYAAQRTLKDIFREVAHTLDRLEITHAEPLDQPLRVREALARQQTLLIVDNLETMEDKEEIISFFYRLPPRLKIVITTRERVFTIPPIRLDQLTKQKTFELISKQAQEKGIEISSAQAEILCKHIGGIPAALVYVIGQVASGYSLETVLERIPQASSDVARFCFEGSVELLRGRQAYNILMALALFPKSPLRSAISYVAGLETQQHILVEGLAQLRRLSLVTATEQERRYGILPLTHEFALAELSHHPDFEREAREKWLKWYLDFVQEHGGPDWNEWHIQYDQVEEEWRNLVAVFDWCAVNERYNEIRTFWQETGVRDYASIYGYWDDRLFWLDWLLRAAERRGDWATAVEAMSDLGFTLTMMGRLKRADELLKRAWDLREHVGFRVQVILTQEIADICIYNKDYEEALSWLDKGRTILDKEQIDEPERTRRKMHLQYYYGLTWLNRQDFVEAKNCFMEMMVLTQKIGWQRATIFAQNQLAEIAIAQKSLDEAESLLKIGLPTSDRNKDKRRTAFYKRSLARLYKERGDTNEFLRWSEEACNDFERLGMQIEAKEMRDLQGSGIHVSTQFMALE